MITFFLYILLILNDSLRNTSSMLIPRPWTTKPWCDSVVNPHWPFAYQKSTNQSIEYKGRVTSSKQDMRHSCTTEGVGSKCHRCELFECGKTNSDMCHFQIQGVSWSKLTKNIPTVSDIPWGVGGRHRYDYDGASHICLITSGGNCLSPSENNYTHCGLRCWGQSSGEIVSHNHFGPFDASSLLRGDADATDAWSYSKLRDHSPQGSLQTYSGTGNSGYRNGPSDQALFSNPRDVAVDSDRNVYIADTDNHVIRKIFATDKRVVTFAGSGIEGSLDGTASEAQFSFPTGVAIFQNGDSEEITIYVSDTGNHQIRKIQNGVVRCISGQCGRGTATETLAKSDASPHPGYADGDRDLSRLNTPRGITVDSFGVVHFCDTGNFLIRSISVDEMTSTLSGTVVPSENIPGCPSPCFQGLSGFQDGSLRTAQFQHPVGITVGPSNTLLVTDDNRVRQIIFRGQTVVQGIQSENRVVTLIGNLLAGLVDGNSEEALLNQPAGIAADSDGRIYTASPIECKIRRLSAAQNIVKEIQCNTRLVDLIHPSGCSSYDEPVDQLNTKTSSTLNNIHYNRRNFSAHDSIKGSDYIGRTLRNCIGVPPKDKLDQGIKSIGMLDEMLVPIENINEDFEAGTDIKIKCPAGCSEPIFGTSSYSEYSSICTAAIHDGVIGSSELGFIRLTIERPIESFGSFNNDRTSDDASVESSNRFFSINSYPEELIEIQTIAGHAHGLLESGCGYVDASPAQASKLNGPQGIAIVHGSKLSPVEFMYIADSRNNVIRYMSSVCSKVCENGGLCIEAEKCQCAQGWTGDDCTNPICSNVTCSGRQLCVGPDTCDCIPGYTNFPQCDIATCVQNCAHGGICTFPDTCSCANGWFDSNCTTPVCMQTCGNGGNCTLPDTCSCPTDWTGFDCRIPVCEQECFNGGHCVAPNTCQCPVGYSGHDCSIPICTQGFFLPDPSNFKNSKDRPWSWKSYVPCQPEMWCKDVNEFDCSQKDRKFDHADTEFGPLGRRKTGRTSQPTKCMKIELRPDAITFFQYIDEKNNTSNYFRYSPLKPFGWNATNAEWRAIINATIGHTPPWTYEIDRQVALTERRSIQQGVYVCANGGNCSAPNVCNCAPGWTGFDCRVPICSIGYYAPTQSLFIESQPPEAKHQNHPVSNPSFSYTIERLTANSLSREDKIFPEGQSYLGPNGVPTGGYACSIRSLTQWEKPTTTGPLGSPENYYVHPNYFSRYQDSSVMANGIAYHNWQNMYWPPLYNLSAPLLDSSTTGWGRGGYWYRVESNKWQKGKCLVEFLRVCPNSADKALNLVTNITNEQVTDTDISYRPRVIYNDRKVEATGRWYQEGGECVDHVLRGCFNNGTCVSPNQCICADGWQGQDCSVPICEEKCENFGICTHPNICTCRRGWTGPHCTIPLCAQECKNGGTCVAPDVCKCLTWPSEWKDGKGTPIYQTPTGEAQETGFTGYDCSTPICTQAEAFILNVERSSPNFESLRGHGPDGLAECELERCPFFDLEVTANDGYTFQAGCREGNLVPTSMSSLSNQEQILNLVNDQDILNVNRTSSSLCGILRWEQGDYIIGREYRINYNNYTRSVDGYIQKREAQTGEGIYKCYNKGSCIAPDTCTCGDGYDGIDCNVPLCRFLNPIGVIVGCQNGGICVAKDKCNCITTDSILHEKYPLAPHGKTGWIGSDCSIAVCVQGLFDPMCDDETAGTEGCYRCANGGKCVAPDMCECAEGWSGFDCKTPVCHVTATEEIKKQLFTTDPQKIHAFEMDPCGVNGGRWGKEPVNGVMLGQGNCTRPGVCTCLCRLRYSISECEEKGELCDQPWSDPLNRNLPYGFTYGTKSCVSGFQGIENKQNQFQSCHLQIYEPSFYRRYTVSFITLLSFGTMVFVFGWYFMRKRIKRNKLMKKAERLRKKREEEETFLDKEIMGNRKVLYD